MKRSYVRKSNTAWLQLYAFLCAQTGCLITGRLPGAKAINALIQAETNPDNAPARLNRIINQQKNRSINGTVIRDMMIQKKSFLVLDWPMRAVNAKGHTKTFQMMVNEQGWTNIEPSGGNIADLRSRGLYNSCPLVREPYATYGHFRAPTRLSPCRFCSLCWQSYPSPLFHHGKLHRGSRTQ